LNGGIIEALLAENRAQATILPGNLLCGSLHFLGRADALLLGFSQPFLKVGHVVLLPLAVSSLIIAQPSVTL
jgi:hypothetical protein